MNLEQLDWSAIAESLNERGYALAENALNDDECESFIGGYNAGNLYRKTINMQRYRFGQGEYKYFSYPLPGPVQELRQAIYPKLAPVANNWMRVLGIGQQYPQTLPELLDNCHQHSQTRPTPLILQYGAGGYNTLHQDLYGDVYFPMQAVLFLSEPGKDYE